MLLQALGVLEEKSGNLAQAEALYIESAKSRNSHEAAWVALAQLRTHEFRQGAAAGRGVLVCIKRPNENWKRLACHRHPMSLPHGPRWNTKKPVTFDVPGSSSRRP